MTVSRMKSYLGPHGCHARYVRDCLKAGSGQGLMRGEAPARWAQQDDNGLPRQLLRRHMPAEQHIAICMRA
jgi:hypothetical protein